MATQPKGYLTSFVSSRKSGRRDVLVEIPESYGVRVTAYDANCNEIGSVEWDGYAILQELWEEIEKECLRRGWFTEPDA